MTSPSDRPANFGANVSRTVTRLVSRQARRGTPTVVSSPVSAPVVTLSAGSTDRAGRVLNWDVPASPTSGNVTITYANPYQPPPPVVVISPTSAGLAGSTEEEIYVATRSTTGFTVTKANAAGGALANQSFNYAVLETDFISPSSTKLT